MESIFVYHDPDAAGGNSSGPLAGVTIAIQPNVSVAGWPTEAGPRALAGFTALEDATLIRRLRAAGAAICGATRMNEFGFGLDGSAAGRALQADAAAVELVLDLMGESRLAADRAGVCGYKPGFGLVSRLGLIGLIPSMECWGLLAADPGRIRRVLAAAAGPDPLDFSQPDEPPPDFSTATTDLDNIRLGVIADAAGDLPEDRRAAFQAAVDELLPAGRAVRPLALPAPELFALVHSIVGSVEASSCAGRYDSVRYGQRAPGASNWNEMYLRSRGAAFGTLVKSYLFQGAYFQFERYAAYDNACRIRARLLADMEKLWKQADFLLLPAESGSPAAAGASLAGTYEQFAATLFANVTGQPALYLPPAPGSTAAGLQLTGPRGSDARLLALGEYLLNARTGGNT
ncbi:MAG: amidase family protein [Desulfosudaceae bacterium]